MGQTVKFIKDMKDPRPNRKGTFKEGKVTSLSGDLLKKALNGYAKPYDHKKAAIETFKKLDKLINKE